MTWFKDVLIPELPKKSVIILDNASFHKGDDLMELVKENGHKLLYLPPYSPELNPIEKLWANLKSFWRSHHGFALDEKIIMSNFIW